jgi:membrane protease YdiL (CAAX protease family)
LAVAGDPENEREVVWCGALIAFVAVSDLITVSMGRPIVPDVMLEGFSAGQPIGLLLALLLLAPLFEELFFRGFLLGALQAVGAHRWVAARRPPLCSQSYIFSTTCTGL